MKRLDKSELIFKIFAYVLVTLFALSTLYPLVYVLSAALSSRAAVDGGHVVLFPIGLNLEAFKMFFGSSAEYTKQLWVSYTNTLFYTVYGTAFSMLISIFAAYALSKRNLVFKTQIQFFIVFTMWFSAGLMPTYFNFQALFVNNRWGIIYGFGLQAFNILLLRNFFVGISSEIEEAAVVDGANELEVLTDIYIPMSKSAIATVTLFYALSRWNGYFWNLKLVGDQNQHPLQVVLRIFMVLEQDTDNPNLELFSLSSLRYAAIVLSIIPIIIVYPYLQKYFAQGVNVGGVKE